MSRARAFGLAACGLLLLSLTGLGFYAQQQDRIETFVAIALAQGLFCAVASGLVGRSGRISSRHALVWILGVAAAMRLIALFAPPYLSTDIYRYVWDGRVLAAGINPYRYIPTDPHLEALRDPDIFPNINRNNYAPTIYPPAAQTIFLAATRFGETVTVIKAAMVVFEAVAIALMLRMLLADGRPATQILIYVWHPLPIWEFAGSGHIDAALVAFVALALWLRRRAPSWATGLALAAAVLTKLYPVVLFPALWRRRDLRMPLVFFAAILIGYLPFLGVGWAVLGFLPGHMAEEGFSGRGAGFYLLSLVQAALPIDAISAVFYIGFAAAALLVIGAFAAFGRRDGDRLRDGALLAATFVVLLSPHYPWYFAWLAVFACLLPCASLLWLTTASFLLYLVPVGSQLVADRSRLVIESIVYLPFLLFAALEWRRQRRREPPRHAEPARR